MKRFNLIHAALLYIIQISSLRMKSEKQSENSKITLVDILLRESMLEHLYLCILSCFYVVVTGLKNQQE